MGLAGKENPLDLSGRRDRKGFQTKLPNLLMKNTKQVIVIRKDLNMRKGKIAAQASHASMAFLTSNGYIDINEMSDAFRDTFRSSVRKDFAEEISHWLDKSFKKVCVYVESEDELKAVHGAAKLAGLASYLIEDNGATEFRGVVTPTCVAIGPHWEERFVGITDQLPLY